MVNLASLSHHASICLSLLVVGLLCGNFGQTDGGQLEMEQNPCYRPCREDSQPMQCHYKFKVEVYYILSLACFNCPVNVDDCHRADCVAADGTNKSIVVANRKLPGPSIQVCKNDVIVVDVENDANPQTTSIHWHGISQRGHQFMDGLPMVTQCPIQPRTTFRYTFPVPEAGTYMWHSHSDYQTVDGLFGALVVRQQLAADDDYDLDLPEHVIVVNDWYAVSTTEEFAKLNFYRMARRSQSILVNGRGRGRTIVAPDGRRKYKTPLSEFHVEQGKRYRFRLIGSATECGIQVSIQGHRLLVIETDGRPIVPTAVDAVNVYSGERYDFVLTANNTVANYWMKFRGLESCASTDTHQMALLRYAGAPLQDPAGTPSYNFTRAKGFVLNPSSSDESMVGAVTMLTTTLPDDATVLQEEADVKLTLRYGYRRLNDSVYNKPIYAHDMSKDVFHGVRTLPLINYVFNQMASSPLLSEYDAAAESGRLCDAASLLDQGKNCKMDACECTHVIKLPLNAVVQALLIDDGEVPEMKGDHPMHLHGHSFRVIAIGTLASMDDVSETWTSADDQVARLQELVEENKLPLRMKGSVYKDTVNVPSSGYALIRFYTDNPGFWFLHCHIDLHMQLGMGLVFQAGQQAHFPKRPKDFPTCGNYVPQVSSNSD